ncbi:putative bacteriophage protein [Salmonella enterica subsp. arizonae]|uniref:Putative bacteriophage protein n=1 Tax=Salmonella enterica subsp. arizonae TaxID=59203 RepID=A0A447R0X1_SALER|nr:putative bacteriophage protein [Salmonella enterica subsp. arizonae]
MKKKVTFFFTLRIVPERKRNFAQKKKYFYFIRGKERNRWQRNGSRLQECLGLPGFPGSEPAVRERLYKYSEGKEGVRRKRVKSKAEEFHISVLPLYVHRYLDDSGEEPTPEPISLQEAEPKDIWEMMFRLLTPEQRKQVTGRFRVKGMKAVFPFLFDDTPPR